MFPTDEGTHKAETLGSQEVAGDMKGCALLLAELVEEDFGIDTAFPWILHVVEEGKHGGSQGFWTGQHYC